LNEVIDSLPQGWDTPVGHAGTGLSVGQRQRLALTRALVSTAPLVVMDEPTAHLDAASEAHVLDGLAALRASGRTVVVIAHRSSVLALADDVITVSSAPAPQAGLTAKDDGSPGSAPAATALTDAEEAAR
jgi:ATP-binding cassette subfamily C protein CydD